MAAAEKAAVTVDSFKSPAREKQMHEARKRKRERQPHRAPARSRLSHGLSSPLSPLRARQPVAGCSRGCHSRSQLLPSLPLSLPESTNNPAATLTLQRVGDTKHSLWMSVCVFSPFTCLGHLPWPVDPLSCARRGGGGSAMAVVAADNTAGHLIYPLSP